MVWSPTFCRGQECVRGQPHDCHRAATGLPPDEVWNFREARPRGGVRLAGAPARAQRSSHLT
eukprot:6026882-Prymnesium_polylepis.1